MRGLTLDNYILDLFCGAGGASDGYWRAGYNPVGVEKDPKRAASYPFPVYIGDAIEAMTTLLNGKSLDFTYKNKVTALTLDDFIAGHGSPPCQAYSRATTAIPDRLDRYDRLIAVTREAFIESGLPYVIENVNDSRPELRDPMLLCGRMFGLGAFDTDGEWLTLDRHRLFETNFPCERPEHGKHQKVQVAGVYGGARRDKVEARTIRKGGYVPKDLNVLRELLDIDWMSEKDLFLAIPPVYTTYIGQQLDKFLQKR